MYKVIEIFDSIEGEGRRSGLCATFIRLANCNLRCNWCDTPHAVAGTNFDKLSLADIINRVNTSFNRVTLTGGEPLLSKNIEPLITALSDKNIEVNIETNGSVDVAPFRKSPNVFFSIDYKLASSGVSQKMLWKNFTSLTRHDVVKFVVASEHDLEQMQLVVMRLIRRYKLAKSPMPKLYATTVSNLFSPSALVEKVITTPLLKNVHVYTQLHKVIGVR